MLRAQLEGREMQRVCLRAEMVKVNQQQQNSSSSSKKEVVRGQSENPDCQ